jgi:prepilin-type N-terminal cleavage/methylation domain-containing protein
MSRHPSVILPPRAGFTLVELLVVVSIIVVVMGAAVAGLSGFGSGTNRLLAAEQLTADLVRQARHAAATSGVPAVIRITQISDTLDGISRVSGGEISGLDSTVLHEQRFEDDDTWQDPDVKDADGHRIPTQGFTGHGLAITVNGTTLKWPTDTKKLKAIFAESPAERLVRSTTAKPGFLLSAAVLVPDIKTGAATYHLPVALIGTDDAPTVKTSLAGLMLRKHVRPLQLKAKNDADTNSSDVAETVTTWEILGWIGDGDGTQAWVSSCDDTTLTTSDLQTTASWNGSGFSTSTALSPGTVSSSTVTDTLTDRPWWYTQSRTLAAPLAGGRWVELGLHYDGAALRLFCDGAVVGMLVRSASITFPTLPADDTHDTIWYGIATLPDTATGAYATRTGLTSDKTCYAVGATLDEVRLQRLGTGPAVSLPNGLRPWISDSTDAWYQITAQPDGRVTMAVMQPTTTTDSSGSSATSVIATATTTLGFAEAADPAFITNSSGTPSRYSLITVTASGAVSATIHLVDGNGDRTP